MTTISEQKQVQKDYAYWERGLTEFYDYLASHQGASIRDVRKAGLESILKKFYRLRINNAKKDVGISKSAWNRGKGQLSEKVWDERKRNFLKFLQQHPSATQEEVNQRYHATFVHHYRGHIAPALKEAGYSEQEMQRFMETYFLHTATQAGKSFIRYRKSRNLESPPLEDLIQRASISIINFVRKAEKHPGYTAVYRAAFFGVMSENYHNYSYAAVHLDSFLFLRAEKVIRGEEIADKKTELICKALNPVNLEINTLYQEPKDQNLHRTLTLDDRAKQDLTPAKENIQHNQQDQEIVDYLEKRDCHDYQERIRENILVYDKEMIIQALDKTSLKEREKRIIRLLYLTGEKRTLEEVGTIEGNVTRERIRQIRNKALQKLQIKENQVKFTKALGMDYDAEDDIFL